MVGALALVLLLGQTGGTDMMTQSGLTSVLQEVRGSAAFYESAAQRHGKLFPFADLARTERRHERLVLALLKTYSVAAPSPPKVSMVPKTLPETLKLAVRLEKHTISECGHYLGFITQQDIDDIFTVIKVTARDIHLPALQARLGPEGPARLTPTQVRKVREKVNRGR
jgi:hypothetical protein